MSNWYNGLFLPDVSMENYGAIVAPAAGANYADVGLASAGFRYQLIALSFTLTTSADVADRRVQLIFRFDHAQVAETDMVMAQAQVVQPASMTVRYLVGPGYVDSTAIIANRVLVRLPFPLELWTPRGVGTGWTMDSDVVNLDNTDQLSQALTWKRQASSAGV